jgi:glycosyltransferase involved in cell wall biosynthesis
MNPLVSVVIPTHNRPDHLAKAIASVLSQTYPSIEVIVVDDGSSQCTADMLRARFPQNILWLRHESPQGAGQARNTGLLHARGEFVAFLDDDDRWQQRKIERQVNVFQRGKDSLGLVGCGYSYEVENTLQKERIPRLPAVPYDRFLRGNWLGSTSLPLIRRASIEKVGGFDPQLPSCQDWDLWLRLSREFEVAMAHESLVVRKVHSGQMTADIERKIAGRSILLGKFRNVLECRPRLHAAHLRRLGILLLVSGRSTEARCHFQEAFRVMPLDVVSKTGALLSLLPGNIARRVVTTVSVVRLGDYRLYH